MDLGTNGTAGQCLGRFGPKINDCQSPISVLYQKAYIIKDNNISEVKKKKINPPNCMYMVLDGFGHSLETLYDTSIDVNARS